MFCTAGTQDLCRIVLPDSGRIQEEDAANANRHGTRSTRPRCRSTPRPTRSDALTLLQPVGYDRPMPVADGIEVDFINAGHLLGSAYARVRTDGQTILFGGDLGRFGRPGPAGSDDGRARRTTCWSSPPTATAFTKTTTTARSWRE